MLARSGRDRAARAAGCGSAQAHQRQYAAPPHSGREVTEPPLAVRPARRGPRPIVPAIVPVNNVPVAGHKPVFIYLTNSPFGLPVYHLHWASALLKGRENSTLDEGPWEYLFVLSILTSRAMSFVRHAREGLKQDVRHSSNTDIVDANAHPLVDDERESVTSSQSGLSWMEMRFQPCSGYEIVFEGMKKYLLGMKKNQFLQISHFIP
jgi:hypothetical protein